MLLVIAILSLGMTKEFLSDYKRTKADKLTNESPHRRVCRIQQSKDGKMLTSE